MTKSITGSFYLTETVLMPVGSPDGQAVQSTLDLSAYVNVPTGLAIAIEAVDFIWQGQDTLGAALTSYANGDTAWTSQLTDLNPGLALVVANNHSLVASGCLQIDNGNNVGTYTSDLYPDNFGPSNLSEAFLVVNDTLFLTAFVGGDITASNVRCTVRVRCRVVKLSTKDWMAIAIQSTAEA
jgi:hypothetical protein